MKTMLTLWIGFLLLFAPSPALAWCPMGGCWDGNIETYPLCICDADGLCAASCDGPDEYFDSSNCVCSSIPDCGEDYRWSDEWASCIPDGCSDADPSCVCDVGAYPASEMPEECADLCTDAIAEQSLACLEDDGSPAVFPAQCSVYCAPSPWCALAISSHSALCTMDGGEVTAVYAYPACSVQCSYP